MKEGSIAEREEKIMQSLEVGKAHEKPRGASQGRKNKEVIIAGKSSTTEKENQMGSEKQWRPDSMETRFCT